MNPFDHDRCYRLSKDCQPSVPNRKRNPRKAPGSRTAHLEEKLDDLVSLIRSQASQKNPGLSAAASILEENGLPTGPATVPSTSSSASTPTTSSAAAHGRPGRYGGGDAAYQSTDNTSPAGSSPSGASCDLYDWPIAPDVAEANLAAFRRDMLPHCALVYLPPATTAASLRRTRPFLWLSVMACTTRSLRQSHAMGDRLRQAAAAKLVVAQEKSMDTLQALLVYLVWPHSRRKDRPFLALWTNLCVAIVQDLGYFAARGESAFTYVKQFWVQRQGSNGMGAPDNGVGCSRTQNSERSMEERRTLMALYIWTSMFSQMTRRDNALGPWSPFMGECLRTLTTSPEWEGDLILATQTRCALVTQQLTDMSIQQQAGVGDAPVPASMFFHSALSAQMDDIWRTMPPSVAQNGTCCVVSHSVPLPAPGPPSWDVSGGLSNLYPILPC